MVGKGWLLGWMRGFGGDLGEDFWDLIEQGMME